MPIYTVLNRYDPVDVAPGENVSEDFTITYMGQLNDGKRDPAPIFQALAYLVAERVVDPARIRLDFYGANVVKALQIARSFRVGTMVRPHSPMSREVVLRFQRQSQVLLWLNWNNPSEPGVYTSKLFEYLAASAPLPGSCRSLGAVADLLQETGTVVFEPDPDAIVAVLTRWWSEYLESDYSHL